MQIQTPIVTMIAKGTWCINEYGMDAMFLLEGAHKALLIDTGTGTFDVAALVRSITEKPLRVVCTHGHVDHVGGIGFFDEVWLHPDDFEMARTLTREQRQGYVTIMNGMSGGLFSVTEEDVKGFDKLPQLKSLHEGDILDLGGRKVTVVSIGCHHKGSLAYIDDKSRCVYSGDELESGQVLLLREDLNAKEQAALHKQNMEKLLSHEAEYDFVCPAHNGSPISKQYIRDFIALDAEIVAGTQTVLEDCAGYGFGPVHEMMGRKAERACHGGASAVYPVE